MVSPSLFMSLGARLATHRLSLWVLAAGLGLSALLSWQAYQANLQRAQNDFERLSQAMLLRGLFP